MRRPTRSSGQPYQRRGSPLNLPGRFERLTTETCDDGWAVEDPSSDPNPHTMVSMESVRSLIATNDSPDIPLKHSINPYRGCEHGCSYCFARPSHSYWGLSPGLDFETKIIAKPNAAEILRRELNRKSYSPQTIALGANTDPYQPIERRLRITRSILEVLHEYRHPVSIVTKSALVLRDRDLLGEMAHQNLVHVYLSITTLDGDLARRMEPRAAAPHVRLDTLKQLSEAGIPTGVLVSPIIPALNDHDLEHILEAAAARGVQSAGYILIRLPHELKELFEAWLNEHYPERTRRVLNLIQAFHNGRLYDGRFGHRMRGEGPYADLLEQRFAKAVARFGLNRQRHVVALDRFRVPQADPITHSVVTPRQLTLFQES